jgi:hypothetical protein
LAEAGHVPQMKMLLGVLSICGRRSALSPPKVVTNNLDFLAYRWTAF